MLLPNQPPDIDSLKNHSYDNIKIDYALSEKASALKKRAREEYGDRVSTSSLKSQFQSSHRQPRTFGLLSNCNNPYSLPVEVKQSFYQLCKPDEFIANVASPKPHDVPSQNGVIVVANHPGSKLFFCAQSMKQQVQNVSNSTQQDDSTSTFFEWVAILEADASVDSGTSLFLYDRVKCKCVI